MLHTYMSTICNVGLGGSGTASDDTFILTSTCDLRVNVGQVGGQTTVDVLPSKSI